jgi:hypothetical protein
MIVGIYHSISNPQKFGEVVGKVDTMIKEGRLPNGIKGLTFAPSTDGRRAFCLWEASSVNGLKSFLEPLTGTVAHNEYFEVDGNKAEGLPQEALAHTTA